MAIALQIDPHEKFDRPNDYNHKWSDVKHKIATCLGLVGSLMMGQVLRRFLFGIGPNDPWTLAAVSVALGAVGAVACFLPALRATRVSPLVALRSE